jgi:exoribonuclease R
MNCSNILDYTNVLLAPPDIDKMDAIRDFCTRLDLGIDFSTPELLQKSLKKVMSNNSDPVIQDAISALLTLPMELATYVSAHSVTSENWWHYGLSIPYYTHFTSPIRRYADVIVHRLLNLGLNTESAAAEVNTDEKLQEFREASVQCNIMREAARAAQLRCDRIYMAVYLANHEQIVDGVVIGIGNKSFTVLDMTYGLTERIFVDELENYSAAYDMSTHSLQLNRLAGETIDRNRNKDNASGRRLNAKMSSSDCTFACMTVSLLCRVKVKLSVKKSPPIDVQIRLIGPI